MQYLKLVRWPNLLIILVTQAVFKYFLIDYYFQETAMTNWQFWLLSLATICIAAAGYIINDIEDVDADMINRPDAVVIKKHISEKAAFNLFLILNCIGMILGFYLSYAVGQPNYAIIFVFSSGLLYLYATRFKSIIIVSNILISLLTAISILMVGVFTILPIMIANDAYVEMSKYIFIQLLIYAGFAFLINFLREIVKDAEDIDGDYNQEIQTIPIALGLKRTGIVVAIVTLAVAASVFILLYTQLYRFDIIIYYGILAILAPLIFIAIKAFMASKKKDFTLLKHLLKGVMITGIASVYIIFQFVLTA
ncbi:4-hydroxybenzoate polyprenyltransferase [Pustulibacterium marinum]|uniref:4-hydroxybenzoate polyprenyltransferase n=1 Tax=Pustulibacterium marinum TaxID=1224947 RepID=A0A1I7H777_9FLAO|nr:geranylgeranylglycerol-phosphate geranylgeranyltransferase [Pustulibacterium marinum]SFU56504.1 4-hydroxybenzoate polyprenyltransferase [Pustulibacterium marinum]